MQNPPFAMALLRPTGVPREDLAKALVATDIRRVASTTHVHDAIQLALAEDHPILLVIDAGDSPERAIAQIRLLKERFPPARVALIADNYKRNDLVSAYGAGANACFVKAMSCDAFFKTLELIMLGETILPPEILPFIGDHEDHHEHPPGALNGAATESALSPLGIDPVPRLSAREKCILRCIVEGHSNKAIARKVRIAEATVKVHVKAILRKVRLNNRTQAAIWAMNHSSLVSSTDADQPSAATMVVPPPLSPEAPNGSARAPVSMNDGGGLNVTLTRRHAISRKIVKRKFE